MTITELMEAKSIIDPCLETRIDFELFKSNTCHSLKEK